MGAVKIGHDVQGGSGLESGYIFSDGKLAGVSIGGSLIGGSNGFSGEIMSNGDMGAVKIGHDLQGGSGGGSGDILSNGKLAGVSIGGSLIGGSNTDSGAVESIGDMGAVKIAHDFTGDSIIAAASLDRSGFIQSHGRISSVTVGGSIISGIDDSNGALTTNATIRADNDIGSLTVKGGLIGNKSTNGFSPVIISAGGQAVPGAKIDLAIGRISIGGRVEFANILAGYNIFLNPVNGDAQIGAVKVGGDWVASNLVAGVINLGADDIVGGLGVNADNVNFGDSHDLSIGPGIAAIVAKIASITIGGQVFGTPKSTSSTDHFGFVAQQIGALKIGGIAIVLTAGQSNNSLRVGETTDLTVHEV